jgi:cholera toxin transcriptional activator
MPQALKYKFGQYEADVNAAELRHNGTRLKLQMQPFQVLVALLERPKEVVTREELRSRLWPEDTFVDFDHGLNTAMAKLRDVLGDSAARPRYIETIAKRGYRFLAEVEAPETALSSPGAPTATPAGSAISVAVNTSMAPANTDYAGTPAATEAELPRARRGTSRLLFVLVQVMYLIFYLSALFDWQQLLRASFVLWPGGGRSVFTVYLVTSLVGVVVRLYLITATAFDYHLLADKYRVLFPWVFLLDMIWAAAPLLLADRMGWGLALGATAALVYLPFAQRVLVKMLHQSV